MVIIGASRMGGGGGKNVVFDSDYESKKLVAVDVE